MFMIREIIKRAAFTTPARSISALIVPAAVVMFGGGVLLGYLGTRIGQARPVSLVTPPVPVMDRTPSPGLPSWETYFLGHVMTSSQRYTCEKFGPACRIALAVQAAENLKGDCEAYHYNSDGTLDWGYFQINSVHLTRRGVNLRDLLDCKANIDFAYQLYTQEGFRPWSTFGSGQYRKFLGDALPDDIADPRLRYSPEHLLMSAGLSSR
jgi:hypothetical protein